MTLPSGFRLLPALAAAAAPVLAVAAVSAALHCGALSALRSADGSATLGSVDAGPGVLLLEDVQLPRYGFTAPRMFVFCSIGFTGPVLDSILVPRCSVVNPRIGRGGDGRGRTRTRTGVVRIDEALFVYGPDTALVCCRLAPLAGGGRMLSGTARGSWGRAAFSLTAADSGLGIEAGFDSCSSLPGGLVPVPQRFRDHRFSGSLEGSIDGESLGVDGLITGLDGSPVHFPFSLRGTGGEEPVVEVETDLSGSGGLLSAWASSIDSGAFVSMEPEGRIRLVFEGGGRCGYTVTASVDSARIHSRYISADTVVFDAGAELSGTVDSSTVTVDSGSVRLGSIVLGLEMTAGLDSAGRLDLHAWNSRLEGADISRSIPAALAGRLEGTSLSGWMALDLSLVVDPARPESCDIAIDVDASSLSVDFCPVQVSGYRHGGVCTMRDSWGNTRRIQLDPALNDSLVTMSGMPPWFEGILCCAEDGSFRSHGGFSPEHIRSSLSADVSQGRFARGGSTLTMQLARNLFLSREKTLARKLQEVFLTWRLEETLSKDRMLEIYINIVELGPDVFGFREASRYYFGVEPALLDPRQTAYLVSLLPGPRVYHGFFERGSVPGYWEDYLDVLLASAFHRGALAREDLDRWRGGRITFAGSSGGV